MKKTGSYGYLYDFSVDYDAIAVDDILEIHNYLMKKNNIWAKRQCKQFLDFLKNVFYSNDVFQLQWIEIETFTPFSSVKMSACKNF